jgi:Gly-Xaa carboxypeptidase
VQSVTSLTNYRIDLFETTQDTIDRLVRLLTPLANEMNMTFALMNEHPEVVQNVIRLETFGIDLEPAPLTPAEGPAWDLIGGTIKNQFPDTVVVPSAMTAFTDTRCELFACQPGR